VKEPVVVIGVGEMGSIFASGFLRLGHPVFPVVRGIDLRQSADEVPRPALVLIAVSEADLKPLLTHLPENWQNRLGLLQNELLPHDWAGFREPTVIAVWFEKKKGQNRRLIMPSPVYGPQAPLLASALESIEIPTRILASPSELLHELVLKNVYILTSNICGLETDGTVGELWAQHQGLAREVAAEVIELQTALTGEEFEPEVLIEDMVAAFNADPDHVCMGRSALDRLTRAVQHADRTGLKVPKLRQLLQQHAV